MAAKDAGASAGKSTTAGASGASDEQDTGAASAAGSASADAEIGRLNAEGTPLAHASKPDKDSKALSPAAKEADVEDTGIDLTDTVLEGAVPAPTVPVEPPSGPRDTTPRILGVFKPGDGRRYHPGDEKALEKDGLSAAQLAAGRREGTLAGAWNTVLDDPNYDPSQPDGFAGAGGRVTSADLVARNAAAGNPTAKDSAIASHAAKGGDARDFAAETGADPDAPDESAEADSESRAAKSAARKSAASKTGAKSAAKKGASAKKR